MIYETYLVEWFSFQVDSEVLLRTSEESVPEEADRLDVRRSYDAVLTAASATTMAPSRTDEDT